MSDGPYRSLDMRPAERLGLSRSTMDRETIRRQVFALSRSLEISEEETFTKLVRMLQQHETNG